MSIRMHVIGARGSTGDELRSALDSIDEDGNGSQLFRRGASNNWQWAQASVWQVDGDAIDRALSRLAVPTFRATTADGVLWTLTLQAPGKEPFHGVHHFTAVGSECETQLDAAESCTDPDFPEEGLDEVAGIHRYLPELEFLWDAEEEARLRALHAQEAEATIPGLEGYADYGARLPAETIEAMRGAPHRAAHIAFQAHGRQIVAALEELGLEFDRESLLALLTTGPLTASERDSDVGNLPRFLNMLGVVGVWESPNEDESEGTAPPCEPVSPPGLNAANYPAKRLQKQFDRLLPKCALSPLDGGNVEASHVALLHLLSHLLWEDPDAYLALQVPVAGYQPNHRWEDLEGLEVDSDGNHWRFYWKNAPHSWYGAAEPRHLTEHSLSQAVRDLPEGTRWEIALRVEGLREQCHRYAGAYASGRWTIEQTYPQMTREQLSNALALVTGIFHCQQPIALLSEQETAAVRRSYLRAIDEPARIRHGKIKFEYGSGATVIQAILFERYQDSGLWDVRAARDQVEKKWEEYSEMLGGDSSDDDDVEDNLNSLSAEEEAEVAKFQAQMEQLNASLKEWQQCKVVPHRSDVVFRGLTGSFWQADLADLSHVSPEMLKEHDSELKRLGFSSIGDFAAEVDQRQAITRCYAGHPQAMALFSHRQAGNDLGWASSGRSLVSVDFSQGNLEFHTDFEDGSCLTTASLDGARSRPDLGVYVRCYEEVPVAKLWEKHWDGIERFRQHRRTQPCDHVSLAKPAAFLARMDRLFARLLNKSSG